MNVKRTNGTATSSSTPNRQITKPQAGMSEAVSAVAVTNRHISLQHDVTPPECWDALKAAIPAYVYF